MISCMKQWGKMTKDKNEMRGKRGNAGLRAAMIAACIFCCLVFASRSCNAQKRIVSMPTYMVLLSTEHEMPSLVIEAGGSQIFRLPIASGLSTPASEETLSDVAVGAMERKDEAQVLTAQAKSSLWQSRRFVWKFFADHIEYQQFASGMGNIKRCYFFANGISGNTVGRMPLDVNGNSTVYADKYFSPKANLADIYEYPVSMPESLGVTSETPRPGNYDAFWMSRLFTPPPLMLASHRNDEWVSLGIGVEPGKYRFNALEYSGSVYAGASWWVNYQGREQLRSQTFSSPVVALHFTHDRLDALREYVQWLNAKNFSTQHISPMAKWNRLPIFCGWAEQTVEAKAKQEPPRNYATQANYEKWIGIAESRAIPISTIVIDDKWQKKYGTFEVDEEKWPDMRGFVSRQHALGRHVLLWVPALQTEGLPDELTVHSGGRPVDADVTNPKYEQMMRAQIHHLVADVGIDGFKEDWIAGLQDFSATEQSAPVYGIEFVRRFQWLLYDETHKCKSDALVETQTPNPLFRESSDVSRLNDVFYGARNLRDTMLHRAQIAWLAGWPLVDTDNGGATNLEEWHSYFEFQPQLGIPALYFVSKTENTKETVPDSMWHELAAI